MFSYINMLYLSIRGEILVIPGKIIALAFIVFLFVFPVFTPEPYFLRIIIIAMIFAIFAASWDVLAGCTGQLNLGHSIFFGVSGYTAALLNLHLDLPPYVTIPVGAIAAVLLGLFAGMPALRLRGFYLALVTLSFPFIVTGIIYIFSDFSGGELGLSGLNRLSDSGALSYYIVLLVFLASIFIMWKVTDTQTKVTRAGVVFRAIREDEIATRMSGINTTKYKLVAFGISGFFAGIAGGLYAHYMRVVGPSMLDLFISFQPILWTIFGGMATIYGSVTGVFVLFPLLEILSTYQWGEQIRYFLFSVILIATLLFMPEGISVWVRDKLEVRCPRCKLINAFSRSRCRACRAFLRAEKNHSYDQNSEE
jgi:branched-chain amino acid transport system permease protein